VPRVSVVIPAFNYAEYLGDALDSVLAQTMDDWECIVVDDGSTDDTPAVARAYASRDSRIRFLQQQGRGPAGARNAGVRESTGTYLQFLDADDRLAPGKLEFHARFLDENPSVDIAYGFSTYFRTTAPDEVLYSLHGHLSRPLTAKVNDAAEALKQLELFNIMPVLSALLRRTVWERVSGFNEAVRGTEDWDFWLRAAIAGCTFRFVDADGARPSIRIHGASASQDNSRMIRSVVNAAQTFGTTTAPSMWSAPHLPLIYEMAAGIGDIELSHRLKGAARIRTAVRHAPWSLTRLRWMVYAAAAYVLPRRAFWWLVTRPMPERGLELLRRLRGERRRAQL